MPRSSRRSIAVCLSLFVSLLLLPQAPARASFHLWNVKEVFTNADGSVQFIELFNSFSGEQLVNTHTLRADSDGVIKDFTLTSNLPSSPSTSNTHFLVATPGFGSLPGGVTPDFTLPDPGVSGPFFDPNASNITITFLGSGDSMSFTGSMLPTDGFQSLTDMNATGFPPGTPNITVTDNSPTAFPNVAGQIDLRPAGPNGDYNGDGTVDAADYVVWRKTLNQAAVPAGSGADGDESGTVDPGDYTFWVQRFGNVVAGSGSGAQGLAVPEPATHVLLLVGLLLVTRFAAPAFPAFAHQQRHDQQRRGRVGPGPAKRGVQ